MKNANGVSSLNPGLPAPGGLPWVARPPIIFQPQRGCVPSRRFATTPSGLTMVFRCTPKVARSSQPWAERRSPVGAVADTSALDRERDQQVYALYGLTPEEIKIVEEATK